MMKVTFSFALVLLCLGSAWSFVVPQTKTSSTSTKLDVYSGRSYYSDDAYSTGSSFLQGNMVNDPYAFERRYDRNKDDVRIDPWGWRDNVYYGRGSYERRMSPYYNDDYYYGNGYNNYNNGYYGGGYNQGYGPYRNGGYNNGYYGNGYNNNGYNNYGGRNGYNNNYGGRNGYYGNGYNNNYNNGYRY